jgi:hypothetical protein
MFINYVLLKYWEAKFYEFDYNWRKWCEQDYIQNLAHIYQETSSEQQESEDPILNKSDHLKTKKYYREESDFEETT